MALLEAAIDEAKIVADYIVGEMNRNAKGSDTVKMKELNSYSATEKIKEWQQLSFWRQLLLGNMPRIYLDTETSCHQTAIAMWILNVRQDGPWDHKPYIRKTFHPRKTMPGSEQVWHRYQAYDYFYDIWSNIHYGYVANAAGFTLDGMLDGAGLEQAGTDVLRWRKPESRAGVSGLRSLDDASDQAAITLGFNYYYASKGSATTSGLLALVTSNSQLRRIQYKKEN